jgi:hypothetical protein
VVKRQVPDRPDLPAGDRNVSKAELRDDLRKVVGRVELAEGPLDGDLPEGRRR